MNLRTGRVILATLLYVVAGRCSSVADSWQEGNPAVSYPQLAAKYQLGIVTERPTFPVKLRSGEISGRAAPEADVRSYMSILCSEWNLYPRELIQKTGLKRIILCADLAFAGQRRNAIPDFENSDLYLEVSRGRYDDMYIRKVIHHEYFHMIDWKDDGQVYRDTSWAALNSPEFKYGSGGKNAQDDPTVSLDTPNTPGFVNRYSATGVEEDKAEVFCYLLTNAKQMEERAKSDTVLRAKITRMKELVKTFCAQAEDKFWREASKVVRKAN